VSWTFPHFRPPVLSCLLLLAIMLLGLDAYAANTCYRETAASSAKAHYGRISSNTAKALGDNTRNPIQHIGVFVFELRITSTLTYNNKGEVVNVDHSNNTFDKSYDFDGIGNRKSSTEDGATTSYTVNALNQYTAVGVAAQSYDEDGNTLTSRLPVDPNNDATLEWNGNNRLTKVTLADGTEVFTEYDFKGRRFREVITTGAASTYKYWIYDGWNPIAEYTRTASDSEAQVSKTFYWGKEITGNLGDAGGVGGLLAEYQHGTSSEGFFPLQDGNGNVTEYLDSTGAVAAHYQYDSFGKTLVQSGAKADSFSHRFSTVYYKPETGLYDYGLRMMNVNTGRFVNRDPAEEEIGGSNLYAFVMNDGVNKWDLLGLLFYCEYTQTNLFKFGYRRELDFLEKLRQPRTEKGVGAHRDLRSAAEMAQDNAIMLMTDALNEVNGFELIAMINDDLLEKHKEGKLLDLLRYEVVDEPVVSNLNCWCVTMDFPVIGFAPVDELPDIGNAIMGPRRLPKPVDPLAPIIPPAVNPDPLDPIAPPPVNPDPLAPIVPPPANQEIY